jgi:gliding motility-associated-like protein/uncharacterized repeat protein (TIGR01451 family)
MVKHLRILLSLFLILICNQIYAQNCTINAGVNQTVCPGQPFILSGTASSSLVLQGNPVWTQIAGPAITLSATTNVKSGETTTATATVTNFSTNVPYTFRITGKCQDGSTVSQDVTYTVSSLNPSNAGPDKSVCPGTFALQGSALVAGETGIWTKISGDSGMPDPTNPNSPGATLALSTSAGTQSATYRWTVSKDGCTSFDDVVITNLGTAPISAGSTQNLSCYNVTTSTILNGSYAATNVAAGQKGTWSFVSGPSLPAIANVNTYNTGVSNLSQGTYVFRWTVTGPCYNGSSDVTINVAPASQNVTNAGGNTAIYCDGRTSIVLNGPQPSYAGETVQWTMTSGPGNPVIMSPNTNVTTVTGLNPAPGNNYTFRYLVTNPNTNCTSSGNYNIQFKEAPALNISTSSPYFGTCSQTSVVVDYTATGGTNTQYALISAPAGSTFAASLGGLNNFISAAPSGTSLNGFDQVGTYVLRYRRSTNNSVGGCADAYSDIKIVISLNASPSNAGTKQILACNVVTATLSGNMPTNGIGTWTQVSGPNMAAIDNPLNAQANISGLVSGMYTFRWIISGGDGACVNTQSDVAVVVSANLPVVSAAGNAQNTCFGTPVTLAANVPLSEETGAWTAFKGNPLVSAPEIIFSNVNAPNAIATGLLANTTYTFTWKVSNACNSNSSNVVITTSATAGTQKAVAGADQCIAAPANSFTLTGGNVLAAGETGTWTLLPGAPNTPTLTPVNGTVTQVTGAVNGSYLFQWAISNGACSPTLDTVRVTISGPATTANAGSDQNICGTTVSLAGNQPAIGTGTWTQSAGPGGAIITNPSLYNTTVTGLIAGRYTFTWTISNGPCVSNSASVTFNVSSPSTIAVAGPDQTICNATSTTLAANTITNGTGTWATVSGPTIPAFTNVNDPHTQVSNLVYGVYVLQWVSAGGVFCPSSTSNITLTVTQNAYAGANQTLCNTNTTTLVGNANSTGNWTLISGPNAPAFSPSGSNGSIVTGLITGTYVFQYTIPATGSCPATSAQVTVSISAPASTADAGPDQQFCSPTAAFASVQLAANAPGTGTGQWSIMNAPTGSTATFSDVSSPTTTFNNLIPGVYLLQWQITNGNCAGAASSNDFVRITISQQPTTAQAGPNQVNQCTSQINLSGNTPVIGLGTWTLVSGPNVPTIDLPNSPATGVIGTIPGTYVFRWTIANGVCTSSTSDVQVIVSSVPPTVSNAGTNYAICTTGISTNSTLNGNQPSGAETGVWTVVSSTGSQTTTFSNANDYNTNINGLTPGVYTLQWTLKNGSCSSESAVVLTVYDPPTPAVVTSADQSICLYQPVNLTANTVTAGTGTWSASSLPPGAATPTFTNANGTSTSVLGLQPGVYKFIFTTVNGPCTQSVSAPVTITIVEPPTPSNAGVSKTTCFGTPVALTANTPTVGTGTWTVTSGQPIANYNFSNASSASSTFTATQAGLYILQWTTNNGICTSSSTTQITVQPALDNNTINAAITTICGGSTVAFTAGTPVPTGGTNAYTYQWQVSTDNVAFNNIAGATNPAYTSAAIPNATAAPIIYYYRRVVNSGNCTSLPSASIAITVNPSLSANTASVPTNSFCFSGIPGPITGSAMTGGNGTYTYQWQLSTNGGTYTNIALNGTSVNYDPGTLTNSGTTVNTYRYRRVVTSSPCSSTSNVITITVNPRPVLTSAATQTICSNRLFSYTPTSGVSGTTFTWTRAAIAGISNPASAGANTINETLINTTNAPIVVNYVYTLIANACVNTTTYNVAVTVNPSPIGTNAVVNTLTCTNPSFTYNLQTNVNNTAAVPATFTWTVASNGNVSGQSAGSGNIIAQTLLNSTTVTQNIVYTITPTATASGACSGVPFTLTVEVPVCAGIKITKTTTAVLITQAGQQIPYTIVVTNTGAANQTNVVVTDPLLGGVLTNPVMTGGVNNTDNILEAGETWTFNKVYTVLQSDIDNNGNPTADNGKIINTASLTSTQSPVPQTASTEVPILATTSFTVAKSSTTIKITAAAQLVPYTITVTNTGNTAISNVMVSDPLLTNIVLFNGDLNSNDKLDKNEIWTFTGNHIVTQDELDNNGNTTPANGNLHNVVTVNGDKPNGTAVGPQTSVLDIPIQPAASFTVIKASTTSSITAAGQVVPYTITVANTGKVAISNLVVNDPLINSTLSLYSGDIDLDGKLDVSETWTYRGNYTITQADIDNNGYPVMSTGSLVNQATVAGVLPNAAPINGTSNVVTIPIVAPSAYTIVKASNTAQITTAGQLVPYSVTVQNTGNAAISNVVITDAMLSNLVLNSGDANNNNKLDVNETWVYGGSYSVTQADLNNNGNTAVKGVLSNTASLSGRNPDGSAVGILSSTKIIPLNTSTSFTLVKSADKVQVTAAGQVINYTITVKNNGATAINTVTISDPLVGGTLSGPSGDTSNSGILDVTETWVYTGSYTVTQNDIDNNGNITPDGKITNLVTVSGKKPDASSTGSLTTVNEVPIVPVSSLSLTKTSNVSQVTKAGDIIVYTVTANNTGATAINNVLVTDPMVSLIYQSGDLNGNAKLDLTESWKYTGNYVVTQADIDENGNGITAGKLVNTASANGRSPKGMLIPDVTATANVNLAPLPGLKAVKASTTATITSAGQIVPYFITLSNTGTAAVANVAVTDPLLSSLALYSGDINSNNKLDVNETWIFTGNYTVQQSDIDNNGNPITNSGFLVNSAAAAGTMPNGDPINTTTNTVKIPIKSIAVYEIKKSSTTTAITVAGQIVPYTVTVENTGNVAIGNVIVTDPMVTNLTLASGDANNNGKLDVTETWTYTGTYTVIQSDIDNNGNTAIKGVLSNTASLSGTQPNGSMVNVLSSTKLIPLNTSTLFTVDKTSDKAEVTAAGQVINYSIIVSNTGATAITNVMVNDPLVGATLSGPITDIGTPGALDVGEVWVYKASYTVKQSDIDNNGNITASGKVTNVASVTGKKPDASSAGEVTSVNETPINPTPSFTLTKTADVSKIEKAGDLVQYTILVKNNGPVAINTLEVNDPMIVITYQNGDVNSNGKLDVTETWRYTGPYRVTQTDIDNNGNGISTGKLINMATANGRKPNGAVTATVTTTASVDIIPVPAMTVIKASTTTEVNIAGQIVPYTITVANTGSVVIADVVVTDPLLTNLTLYSGDVNGNDKIDVGETWTYRGNYTVSQADIDNYGKPTINTGNLVNSASVTGLLPDTNPITGTSNVVTIPIKINAAYTITKTSTTTAITVPGQLVPYTVTIKNTGAAAISNVAIADPMLTNLILNSGDTNANAKLEVNETWIYNGTYTVLQSDIDNNGNTATKGVLSNTASLTGKKPDGTNVTVLSSTHVIPLNTSSSFTITKNANQTQITTAGQVVIYTIVVNNTGTTAINSVQLNDPLINASLTAPTGDTSNPGILDAGEAWTYTGSYTVTQADIDKNGNISANGKLANIATVTAKNPDGSSAGTMTAIREIPINPAVSFALTKTSDVNQVTKAGDLVKYTVLVSNTGKAAVNTITVYDPMVNLLYQSGDTNNNGKLDLTEIWTYTGTYSVKQTDMDNNGNGFGAGKLVNTVTANGRKPDGTTVSGVPATAVLTIVPTATMVVKKGSGTAIITRAGQVVSYAVTVANTGSVAISDIAVSDPLLNNINLYSGDVNGNDVMDVGETWTFGGTYTVTQADIDNFGKPVLNSGNLVNTAGASGKLPGGTAINGISNTVIIPIQTNTAYTIEKTSTTTAVTQAGQQVPYVVTVQNIGTSAISNVVITDAMVNLSLLNGDTNGNNKLDVNETWTYSGTYVVKQSDIDNNGNTAVKGLLSNTASLAGKRPDGSNVVVLSSTKVIPLNTSTLFTVTKTAPQTLVTKAGDVINYTIIVSNAGATAITSVTVNDPVLGGIMANPNAGDINNNGVLDVAEAWVYNGSYTVTQADMDRNGNTLGNNQAIANGNIINLVNVSGKKPDGSTAGAATAVKEVPISPVPVFSLTKTSNVNQVSKVGDQVIYTVQAINNGPVAINNFLVNDPMLSLSAPTGDANNNGLFDVAETWIYKGTYTVKQIDIDNNGNGISAGKIINTVNASGRRPDGTPGTVVTATASVDIVPVSAFKIVKSSSTTQINLAGQIVPYVVTVANTGTVALSNIVVNDPMLSNLNYANGDINNNSKLDINETWTYNGSYIVTQSDIDNQGNTAVKGNLINTATVTGNNPNGSSAGSMSSTKNIPVQQIMSVTFTKVATGQIGYIAGQTVTYQLKVTNTGNTTLKNMVITDPNATITNGSPIVQLNPGQVVLVTAVHTLSQADVDAGRVINQASLTGKDPNGNNIIKNSDDPSTVAPDDPTVTQIVSPGAITLVKAGLLSGDGNTITYTFTVKNTGIVTLSSVTISDTKITGAIAVNPATLAPGQVGTATAVYTITAIEKAAEQVSNTAIVTGTSPNGFKVNDVSGTNENNNTPTLVILSKITGAKTVTDANANGIAEAAEVLTYTIVVTNNGTVARTGVNVSDPVPANTNYVAGSASNGGILNANTINWSNLTVPANGSLSISFKVTAAANLPLGITTIANVANIINPAQPGNPIVVTADLPTEGKLESIKTVTDQKGNKDGIVQANEVLTYNIQIKNSGGSTLTGIKISDVIPAGLTYVNASANNGATFTTASNTLNWTVNLNAGATINLSFDATVPADVNNRPLIKNIAGILSPNGQTLQPEVSINVDPSSDLVITKELLTPAPIKTGDRIVYKITVVNAGQNKASGVKVTDVIPGSLDAPYDIAITKGTTNFTLNSKTLGWLIGDLALNEMVSLTFKTRVVATGTLVNTATVTGDQTDPNPGNNTASSGGSDIGGDDLFIPNLFTPNGDGNNDTFEIKGLDQFPDNELTIVNRWGNEVFRTNNYQNNWTGEGLNEGTYYYLLKARKNGATEWKVFKGYITLIRAFKK